MQSARSARADDEIATEADGLHSAEDRLDATVTRMEGTVDIDIDEQIVGESSEALAEDDAASIVGLDSAEGKGDFLARRADSGLPAAMILSDRRPARLSEPELEESWCSEVLFGARFPWKASRSRFVSDC